MSGRNAARIAWALCGLTLALIACAVLLAALQEFTRHYAIYGILTEPGSLPAARVMTWPPY